MSRKPNRKAVQVENQKDIGDLFDLDIQQHRFRGNTLHRICQNTNFAGKYVLWIDFYVIFPYDFDNVEVYLALEGQEISVQNESLLPVGAVQAVCTTPFPNKQYMAASIAGYPDTIGIPFLFDSFSDLEKVEGFTGDVIFTYHNNEGTQNKLVIRVINPVSFTEKAGYRDYVIEKQCTAIPGLLEQDENLKRKTIIESYPEVIHARADLSGRNKNVPLYSNIIRSESSIKDEERLALASRVIDDLIKKERLEDAKYAFLNLFYSTDTEIINAADESMQAYLLGSS